MSVAAFKNQGAKNSKPPPPNFFPASMCVSVCVCIVFAVIMLTGRMGAEKLSENERGKE